MSEKELAAKIEDNVERLDELESGLRRALNKGKDSKKYAEIAKNAKTGFLHRKDAIESLQNAVASMAETDLITLDLLKKVIGYLHEITDIANGIIQLGAANIASNRAVKQHIRDLLEGNSAMDLEQATQDELLSIMQQLNEKEDYLLKLQRTEKGLRHTNERVDDLEDRVSALENTSDKQIPAASADFLKTDGDNSKKIIHLLDIGKEVEAFTLCKELTEKGDINAQACLGFFYEKGIGVEEDEEEAFKCYMKSAKQGDAFAQYSVGACYGHGIGVEEDKGEAFKWLMKSAKQGHAFAQNMIGICYHEGIGVEEDEEEAFKWFMKSAKQGLAFAQYSVGNCYHFGLGVDADEEETFKWFMKSAKQGYAGAQCEIGFCYLLGKGVEEDKEEAFKWFMKSAKQGDAFAQYEVGLCYFGGLGVEEDEEKALKWFMKSAKQGNEDAIDFLKEEGQM